MLLSIGQLWGYTTLGLKGLQDSSRAGMNAAYGILYCSHGKRPTGSGQCWLMACPSVLPLPMKGVFERNVSGMLSLLSIVAAQSAYLASRHGYLGKDLGYSLKYHSAGPKYFTPASSFNSADCLDKDPKIYYLKHPTPKVEVPYQSVISISFPKKEMREIEKARRD